MPLVSSISKKNINIYLEALNLLDIGIAPLLEGKQPDDEYIFKLDHRYSSEDGPAFIAVAKIKNNTYALFAPQYLSDKQMVIFEFLLRDADVNDHLLVFTKRHCDAVQKYGPKNIDVKILI